MKAWCVNRHKKIIFRNQLIFQSHKGILDYRNLFKK